MDSGSTTDTPPTTAAGKPILPPGGVATPASASHKGPRKRLIVACDGTWLNSDNGIKLNIWGSTGQLAVPSNVTRLTRALKPESDDGIPQLIYYQAGLGTDNNVWSHVVGGATGIGISENIREAYAFIASNYQAGDEIFLFGFSRGAYTARSIAAFITSIGLLSRVGMLEFYPVFEDWENQSNPNYVRQFPERPYKLGKKSAGELVQNGEYAKQLEKLQYTTLDIPIKAVGVWETVGALGIPDFFPWPQSYKQYAFVDSKVSPSVEYAYQALGLDEERTSYRPTVWEQPDGQTLPRLLKQCWFPGVHTNIGGGYPDTEVADMTLAWMLSQLNPLLDFYSGYIKWQRELNLAFYKAVPEPARPWACGKIVNSSAGLRSLLGRHARTPGQYTATDSTSGAVTKRPLQNTNERVHPSVRLRVVQGGRGPNDKGKYDPAGLSRASGWKVEKDLKAGEEGTGYQWVLESVEDDEIVLQEERLIDVELALLATTPAAYKELEGTKSVAK